MPSGAPVSAATPPPPSFQPEGVLLDLLAVSLTGVQVLHPVYDAAGALTDFALAYLNPAAQRLTGLAEQPGGTLLGCFPPAAGAGVLSYCRRAYEAGATGTHEVNYPAAGPDRYFRLAARRSGEWLVVSLSSDPSDPDRSALAQALHASQAREQAARAELEARGQAHTAQLHQQQHLLAQILRQVPAAIATLSGPAHHYSFFNDAYQALAGGRARLGGAIAEVFPELVAQGITERLDRVAATGQPLSGTDLLVQVLDVATGEPLPRYVDYLYQPLTDAQGRAQDVLVFVVNVTEKVRARQQAEALHTQLLAAARHQAAERVAFYQVFEQAPVLVALLRAPGHRFEYVNPAYQALFPGRRLVGLDVAEAVPEMQAQGFVALMDRVYQTGETYSGQEALFEAQPAPGQPARPAYYNFSYQAYRENGVVAGISIFAFDATEQVLARQEREAQRRELEQLFWQAPAPIVILDGPDLVFQLVNPAYQRIFPGRALAGKPLLAALPELVGTPIPDLFGRVYQTGEPITVHELPLQMARHEGHALEEIYWTFTYQARRAADGRIDGVRVFAHDVTEQVRARQAAEASAHRLHLLTDALPVLIGYLDHERRYRFANEAYRAWFGQDPAALLGRPVREVVGEAAYAATAGYMNRALAGERLDFEATMPYRDDFVRHIRTSFIPDVQQGVVQGFYTLVSDISEQVEARQQVERLNQELRARNQELHASNTQLTRTNVDLDNFIYTASHDLRAPISNIEGLLLALEHELPAAGRVGKVPRMLAMMQEATVRFQQTISHLTDVSRLQQEHSQASEAVPLAPVIEAVRLDLLPLLAQTRARLEVQVPAGLTVLLSEKNLRSVVYNLLSNALKYHHPDRLPEVHLRGQVQADHLLLEVQDNGLGLDLAQGQDKLFAMFQRLHTHVEGTGIGLYMVKKIVENAGGRIEVASQLDQGSTFRVYFPR